jgi:hypothetical protein
MKYLTPAALLLAALSMTAFADDKVVEHPVASDTLDGFSQQAAHVREQMQPGGIYEHITATDRGRVDLRLAEMQKIYQAHPGQRAGDLPQTEKIALFNAQEEVNGILKHHDNNRLVCERSVPVGTHLPVTTCRPYGEVMVMRDHNQKAMEDMAHHAAQSAGTRPAPGGN